jgi:hypothetical protein
MGTEEKLTGRRGQKGTSMNILLINKIIYGFSLLQES